MQAFVIGCGFLLGLFLGAIGLALVAQPLGEGWQAIVDNPWSLVTLMDLSLGLLFIACWIVAVEPRRLYAAAWVVALAVFGNAATLTFLMLRACRVRRFRELFLPMR